MLMPTIPLKTANRIISVKGKVFYNDRRRRIDVKKPIRDLFDNGSMQIYYVMELCLCKEKLIERTKELSKENVIPVLLYFVRCNNVSDLS